MVLPAPVFRQEKAYDLRVDDTPHYSIQGEEAGAKEMVAERPHFLHREQLRGGPEDLPEPAVVDPLVEDGLGYRGGQPNLLAPTCPHVVQVEQMVLQELPDRELVSGLRTLRRPAAERKPSDNAFYEEPELREHDPDTSAKEVKQVL